MIAEMAGWVSRDGDQRRKILISSSSSSRI
jgi:hypothetical protein